MNPDNLKNYLGFAGAVLVFTAAIINVLNGYYSRLGTKDQKSKFWFLTLNIFISICIFTGMFIDMFTKSLIGMLVLGIGVLAWSAQFLRFPEPANRKEILTLVILISALVLGVCIHFLSRFLDIIGTLNKAA